VLFATVEDASHAVDMFNGYSWQTRILEVRPDRIPTDFDNPMSVGSLSGGPTSVSMGGSSPYVGPSINVHAMPVTQMALMSIMQEEYNSLMASGSSNNGGRNLFVGNVRHDSHEYLVLNFIPHMS
jgi:RNA recognition motif-containing protein